MTLRRRTVQCKLNAVLAHARSIPISTHRVKFSFCVVPVAVVYINRIPFVCETGVHVYLL